LLVPSSAASRLRACIDPSGRVNPSWALASSNIEDTTFNVHVSRLYCPTEQFRARLLNPCYRLHHIAKCPTKQSSPCIQHQNTVSWSVLTFKSAHRLLQSRSLAAFTSQTGSSSCPAPILASPQDHGPEQIVISLA
jgi:hypothetical protein